MLHLRLVHLLLEPDASDRLLLSHPLRSTPMQVYRVRNNISGLTLPEDHREKESTNMKIFNQRLAALWVVFLLPNLASTLHGSDQTFPSNNKSFDGPAELPREYVKSSLKDTPAGGKTWAVSS